jgi:hypothetical protein
MSEVSIAAMADSLPNGSSTQQSIERVPIRVFVARLTRRQRIAFAVYMAEFCLWPLTFILFAFARLFPSAPVRTLPNLWLLQKQYVLLTAEGFDPSLIALALRLFELMVCISLPVILLRLVSAPVLFGLRDLRRTREKMKEKPVKVLFGWFLTWGGLWAAIHIEAAKSAPLLSVFLKFSPYWYICFCALMFVVGLFLVVEVPLLFIETRLRRDRPSAPSQAPSK